MTMVATGDPGSKLIESWIKNHMSSCGQLSVSRDISVSVWSNPQTEGCGPTASASLGSLLGMQMSSPTPTTY